MKLEKVEVKNYRGIKECIIEDLGLINVFVGGNNSCKSTLLDAIYWGLKETISPYVGRILRDRVKRGIDRSDLFFEYNEDLEIKISLTFGKPNVGYSLKLYRITEHGLMKDIHGGNVGLTPGSHVLTFEKDGDEFYYYSVNTDLTTPSLPSVSTLRILEVQDYAGSSRFLHSHVELDELWSELDETLGDIKLDQEALRDLVKRLQDVYAIP